MYIIEGESAIEITRIQTHEWSMEFLRINEKLKRIKKITKTKKNTIESWYYVTRCTTSKATPFAEGKI